MERSCEAAKGIIEMRVTMKKVNNKEVIRRIADKTRRADRGRNIIAVLAIALTTVLFTALFTISGSILKKTQEETMRMVGASSHAELKYLTQEEYDKVKSDKKLREVSCRIFSGILANEEMEGLNTEVNYFEGLISGKKFPLFRWGLHV